MPVKSKYVKCRGCGKKIPRGYVKYCRDCALLALRMGQGGAENIPPKGRKSFWACIRKYGRTCRLSGVSLGIDDFTSPWYLVFGRLKFKDKNGIFPAAALFIQMKSVFTKRLFRYYVLALDDHRRKHLKVKKKPVKHWWKIGDVIDDTSCPVCGRSKLRGRKFCVRCSKLSHRMRILRFSPDVVKAVWLYLHTYGFVCYYTGMPLDLGNSKSPWYLVFDHWNPRDPRKIVVTSALVNKMKGDLTEDEFWYFIRQLANYYRKGSPVKKIKLKFWSRPYR